MMQNTNLWTVYETARGTVVLPLRENPDETGAQKNTTSQADNAAQQDVENEMNTAQAGDSLDIVDEAENQQQPQTSTEAPANTTTAAVGEAGLEDPRIARGPDEISPYESAPADSGQTGSEETVEETQVDGPGRHEKSDLNYKHVFLGISAFVFLVLCVAVVFALLKRRKRPVTGASQFRQPQAAPPEDYYPAGGVEATTFAPAAPYMQAGEVHDAAVAAASSPTECFPASASGVNIITVHNVGNRPNQEDSIGFSDVNNQALTEAKGVLGVVADGMGGLAGGEDVSSMLVLDFLQGFSDRPPYRSADEELNQLLGHAVQEVNAFLTRTVGIKKSGSTLIAVICRDLQLSWVSVGDSRIVLFRRGKLTTLNRRHIYGAELDEMVREGKMSAEDARENPHRGELTSYVGMGELKYVDRSVRPLKLQAGDKVVLMSDGVFNTLSDDEIASILSLPSASIGGRLEQAVLEKQKRYQDNFTALILEF